MSYSTMLERFPHLKVSGQGSLTTPAQSSGLNFGGQQYFQDPFGAKEHSVLPGPYRGGVPGYLASARIAEVLADPYNIPTGRKRAMMQGMEHAYQTARNRGAGRMMGSGASLGGVARGTMGNYELSRGRGMADIMRDWEQYRTEKGDERLRSLGLGYLDRLNQALAYLANREAIGAQTPSDWERFSEVAANLGEAAGGFAAGV